MATKYVGYERVMETKTKGQPKGKILVKLRHDGKAPRWELMTLKDYERRAIIRR
jgi:hypothetical protein